ncbi:hypothetical protein FHU36_003646 [Nonomuraea muscovyensis]|uniref:Uncharacterized protein n=1 Tax=Nonomuraea muscovyensis TaxID=1124761 RepID=A0A7X0C3R4_9ACTN|nr:hypothetical protein [Nonomuraea muscovyensis]
MKNDRVREQSVAAVTQRRSGASDSLTEMATRIRCQNWDSIRSQSMTFLLGSPNSASMCTYSVSFDGR